MNTIAYTIKNNLYLNITNSCTNDCDFCIRNKEKAFNQELDLWLDHEPSIEEIIASIKDPETYNEVVFCGYGEPLVRIEVVKAVAHYLKDKRCKIRVDTNGQASLIHKRDVVPELVGIVDSISISLNAHNSENYEKICHPAHGHAAFDGLLVFASRCRELLPKVQFTLVEVPGIDIATCQQIADSLGIPLKIRHYYEQDYAGFR